MNEGRYLGVEIGGTKLQVVLGDYQANIIDRRRFHVDPARGAAGIRDQIAEATISFLDNYHIRAVGIGFGGPVDWRTGRICCSHHIEGWTNFQLADWMHHLARVPVSVDNDANIAALGEALKGAGLEQSPVFYVTLGSGVGGGLVLDGKIYHGAAPGESEVGHIRLDKTGTILEQRCSGWAVDKKIRNEIASENSSILAGMIGNTAGNEAKHLAKALEADDSLARRILDETAENLAFGLSHVTHLFHPRIIIIGGGLSLLGDVLRDAVQRHIARFVMDAFAPGPEIRLAALGEDAVPVGALLLAIATPTAQI